VSGVTRTFMLVSLMVFFNKEPYKTATLIEADKFLTSLGWLKGEPTLPMPAIDPDAPALEKNQP